MKNILKLYSYIYIYSFWFSVKVCDLFLPFIYQNPLIN